MGSYYERLAVAAARLLLNNKANSPDEAWEIASEAMEEKAPGLVKDREGPQHTFVGIVEAGLIDNLPAKQQHSSHDYDKNKVYAIKAITLLRADPGLASDKSLLWSKVVGIYPNGEPSITHNCQTDVIVGLWNGGLVKKRSHG